MKLYTIRDLMEVSNTTERATRNLFKTNRELKKLADNHIQHDKSRRVYYDETIYEWFVAYYDFKNRPLIENVVVGDIEESTNEEITKHSAPLLNEIEDLKRKNQALQGDFEKAQQEILRLTEENRATGRENERLRDENKALIEQNSHILLLLSQEKAEKQALLPQPRKTIGERIRNLFSKGKQD